MKDKDTPLMRQFSQIKAKHPDCVLLFRMGDFFETFDDDAIIASKVCGLTLTKRNNGAESGATPLAGFPHHQLDAYLPKLVRAGYRVAVCEQLEDPKLARGIVKRGVIEVVTPGVAIYDKLLETNRNNYIASIFLTKRKNGLQYAGFSFADASTGELWISEIPLEDLAPQLESIRPAEIIISKPQKDEINELLSKISEKPLITRLEDWIFEYSFANEILLKQFNTKNLRGFGAEELVSGVITAGAILHYVSETQRGKLQQFQKLGVYDASEYMTLDYATRRNLEIVVSFSGETKNGTLLSILDSTKTPMGGRLLVKWITRPLRNLDKINYRLNAVESIVNNNKNREELRETLNGFADLERLISKICLSRANPRDLISLKASLAKLFYIEQLLKLFDDNNLRAIDLELLNAKSIVNLINDAILDEPSNQVGNGGVFKRGFNEELDSYYSATAHGKEWVAEYQQRQRDETGIPNLKIGFNNVFGYYIEISNSHRAKAPSEYQRKQTLTNGERFTTEELKEFEKKILTAEEKVHSLETSLFITLLENIAQNTEYIQSVANKIANIDCLQCFADKAKEFNYVKPVIDESEELIIEDGRHPVVERLLAIGEPFHPNSLNMDGHREQIHIITGPNMSGKSSYLRQCALIVLLGQVGSFVPAKMAKYGLIDRIFTRVGAQDNIGHGESTFLVEMIETANIINNATRRSLLLLDEVGRGTATLDGISIAWAIAEYIHEKMGAKTLFATHYHELSELEERFSRVKNKKVEVLELSGQIVFSHKVTYGASEHSFGINVAKMAGLPKEVISRSVEILKALEHDREDLSGSAKIDVQKIETVVQIQSEEEQMAIFEFRDDSLRDKIRKIEIDNITPLEALKLLAKLKKEAGASK